MVSLEPIHDPFSPFFSFSKPEEVRDRIQTLMQSIQDLLKVQEQEDPIQALCAIRVQNNLQVSNIQKISDTFLQSIGVPFTCDLMTSLADESFNSQKLNQEIQKKTIEVFQQALLKEIIGSFSNISMKEETKKVFSQVFPKIGKVYSELGNCLENFKQNLQLLETADKVYLLVKDLWTLFDVEGVSILKFSPTLRGDCSSLEKSLTVLNFPKAAQEVKEALTDVNAWHKLSSRSFNLSTINQQVFSDYSIISVKFANFLGREIYFQFHAQTMDFGNNFKFFAKTISSVSKKKIDFLQQKVVAKAAYNCMSFGVGRVASKQIIPGGDIGCSEKLDVFIQDLKEHGCIHLGTLNVCLPSIENSKEPYYLAAFVHNPTPGFPDFHVYRCFQSSQGALFWMELIKGVGLPNIQLAQDGKENFIKGIPDNPIERFCKGQWNTFVGYWLIPPNARFVVGKTVSLAREELATIVPFSGSE